MPLSSSSVLAANPDGGPSEVASSCPERRGLRRLGPDFAGICKEQTQLPNVAAVSDTEISLTDKLIRVHKNVQEDAWGYLNMMMVVYDIS